MVRNKFLIPSLILCIGSLSASQIWLNVVIKKAEYRLQLEIQTSTNLKKNLDSLEKKIKDNRMDSIEEKYIVLKKSENPSSKSAPPSNNSIVRTINSPEKNINAPSENILTTKNEFAPLDFKSYLKVPVEVDEYLNILYVSISLFEKNYSSIKFTIKKQDLTDNRNIAEDYPFALISYSKNADSTFHVTLGEITPANLTPADPANYRQVTIKISGKLNSEIIDCLFIWKDIIGRLRTAKIKLHAKKGD